VTNRSARYRALNPAILEVGILSIRLAIPCACNAFVPSSGFPPEEFPYPKLKVIPLDRTRMIAQFAPGIEIPPPASIYERMLI
jgi:acetamidase/formamidase